MKKQITQKVLTIISFMLPTILLGIWIFSTFFLADNVAIHFNLNGVVDRIGSQYEMLILGFVRYLVPMIMAIIFANVKAFWSRLIGIIGSICVSITYFGVSVATLVKICKNSNSANFSAGLWVSFALAIIGFACIVVSHILPFIRKNLLFRKQSCVLFKNCELNKINVNISVMLFLFGFSTCVGCSALKNFYSFIVFFAMLALCVLFCYLHLRRIVKKNFVLKEVKDY